MTKNYEDLLAANFSYGPPFPRAEFSNKHFGGAAAASSAASRRKQTRNPYFMQRAEECHLCAAIFSRARDATGGGAPPKIIKEHVFSGKIQVIYMHTPSRNLVARLATIFSLSAPNYHVRNRSWKCFSALKELGFSISILVRGVNRSGRRVQTFTCYFRTCTAKLASGHLRNYLPPIVPVLFRGRTFLFCFCNEILLLSFLRVRVLKLPHFFFFYLLRYCLI